MALNLDIETPLFGAASQNFQRYRPFFNGLSESRRQHECIPQRAPSVNWFSYYRCV